jgi:hypothetical protein
MGRKSARVTECNYDSEKLERRDNRLPEAPLLVG